MDTAIEIIKKLKASGFDAFLVGGAVRDLLLGKKPKDFDVATSADPLQVKKLFSRTVDTGIQHGTVLVLLNNDGVEVTTFRTESNYTDNRRPDKVQFVKSLEEDLKRRDFTINAMAMTESLELVDLFGGRKDLENKTVRAVGEAEERFREDALRMLRAVRFSGQLDFTIDLLTLEAIKNNAHRLQSIAVERIKIELDKILANQHACRSIDYLNHSGLSDYLPAGGLFQDEWGDFKPSGDPLSGWLYALWKRQLGVEALNGYRFSNAEKKVLTKALEAAKLDSWDQWTYYTFSNNQLELAAVLTGKEGFLTKKYSLPIESKSDLAVNGRNLMEWSDKKAGPWLKEAMGAIERLVVYGELENEKDKIKEWFLSEYNRNE